MSRVETRNGARLLIESPRSGQWIALCPLELEALTWQNPGDVLGDDRPTPSARWSGGADDP